MPNSSPQWHNDLPPSSSPTLLLTQPTSAENNEILNLNAASWRGALSLPAYLRREAHLANQAFTRDGGLTSWILVDGSAPHDPGTPRRILSSCETLRKRGLVARREGRVEEVVCHGVGSVFCTVEFRGRGYAGRMMKELGKELERWQQSAGAKARFAVLYSDIGKKFYARNGWHPFPSSHISLPPAGTSKRVDPKPPLPPTRPLKASDLAELCDVDERLLRQSLSRPAASNRTRVALIPDAATIAWHHAREEFLAEELKRGKTQIKGAIIGETPGQRAWIIWTRTFNGDPSRQYDMGNKLDILRIVVEDEYEVIREDFGDLANVAKSDGPPPVTDGSGFGKPVQKIAYLLAAAQQEAARSLLGQVQAWNPTPTVVEAAKLACPEVGAVIDRESQSIPSLKWYGEGSALEDVDWIGNEKYGWC